MNMLRRTTRHTIYEVWCPHTCESVYIDHKPTKKEIEEVRKKNWPETARWDNSSEIETFKIKCMYTYDKKIRRSTVSQTNRPCSK
jgi:hypothetical protein